jgi:hypothetical protein
VILRTVDIARVGRVTAAVTAVAAATAALTGVGRWPSVALGGAVMIANYHLIRMLVSRLIGADRSTGKAAFALVAKMVLMIALVAGVLYRFPIAPGSFAVGATSLLVAMLLEACLFGTPVPPLADDGEDFEGSDS